MTEKKVVNLELRVPMTRTIYHIENIDQLPEEVRGSPWPIVEPAGDPKTHYATQEILMTLALDHLFYHIRLMLSDQATVLFMKKDKEELFYICPVVLDDGEGHKTTYELFWNVGTTGFRLYKVDDSCEILSMAISQYDSAKMNVLKECCCFYDSIKSLFIEKV